MEENNLKENLEELNKVLGQDDMDIDTLVQSLGSIKSRLNANEKLIDGLERIQKENEGMKDIMVKISEHLADNSIQLPETFDVNVKNTVDEVTVKNLSDIKIPETPKELKVSNLTDIPDYKSDIRATAKLIATMIEILNNKELKSDLDRYLDPKRPLAVRLSDGRKFYEAIATAVASGSMLTDKDGHGQVDILTMPEISVTAEVDTTGLATESKQDDIITALGSVSIDPTGLSTEAKQDDGIALLTTIDSDTSDIKTAVEVIDDIVKTEDAQHSSGDKGVMLLGVRQDNSSALAGTDGDYMPLSISEHNCLNVDPQHYISLDDCDSTDGWTVINNDTDNLTTSTNHIWKTKSLSFDKVDGAGNTIFAGIQKTLTSTSINKFIEEGGGFFLGSVFLTSVADVSYVWFRVGTDSSNYNEWRIPDTSLTAGQWNALRGQMRAPYSSTGDGINTSAVTYMAIGVAFDGQDDTLAGILVDGLFANSGLQTSSDITSQISSSVSSPNVKVAGWLGNVSTGAGVNGTGVLRVTIATDDEVNNLLGTIDTDTSNISTKIDTIAGAVAGTEMQVDVVSSALPTGASTSAKQDTIIGHVDGIEALLGTIDTDTSNVSTKIDTIAGAVSGTEMQVDLVGSVPAGTNAIGKLLPPDIDITGHTNYIKKYYTNTGAVTDGIIWSPSAGKRWHVVALFFQTSADATITFEDDLTGGDSAVLGGEYKAGGGGFLVFPEKYPLASGEDASDLMVTTSAGNIYVTAVGYEI